VCQESETGGFEFCGSYNNAENRIYEDHFRNFNVIGFAVKKENNIAFFCKFTE